MDLANNIAAIILAAGYSSRMGSFKPLLPLGNTTMIEKSVSVFKSVGINHINVVVGHRSDELLPVLEPLQVNIVVNSQYVKGMFSSVQAGVASLKPTIEAFFLLPGDIPLVQPTTLLSLLTAYQKEKAGIIYPSLRGEQGHPPLISTVYKEAILTWQRDGGLRSLLQEFASDAENVEVADQGVLLDMDTPEDYQRIRANLGNLPTRLQCLMILSNSGVSDQVSRHCRTVASIAEKIVLALDQAGYKLNIGLILAAALLHDIARGEKNHAQVGAQRLRNLGYPLVAEIVARHMDLMVSDDTVINEATVVYLADKLVMEDQLVSLDQRWQDIQQRYADHPKALTAATRRLEQAQRMQQEIEKLINQPLINIIGNN